MPLPAPRPGLVIGYAYLWLDEHRRGQAEGDKDRPCVIVLSVENDAGEIVVAVAPVTHSPPEHKGLAVEIPAVTKQRLGLDMERSWVILTEVNRFVWPGPDLRPVSRSDPSRFEHGMLPPALFTRIKTKLLERARQHKTRLVVRQP